MRLIVDRDRCEGHGMCAQAAPGLVELNDDWEPIVKVEDVSAHLAEAREAVHACPVVALRLE